MPLIDNIIIGVEFRQLCKQHSAIQMDWNSVRGKTVYLEDSVDIEIKGIVMEANFEQWNYLDAKTDELIISYREISAGGGFLTGLYPGGFAPLTFKGRCSPDERFLGISVFKELGMTRVDRKNLNLWRKNNANN